jgi:hypothetical protein
MQGTPKSKSGSPCGACVRISVCGQTFVLAEALCLVAIAVPSDRTLVKAIIGIALLYGAMVLIARVIAEQFEDMIVDEPTLTKGQHELLGFFFVVLLAFVALAGVALWDLVQWIR